MNGICRNRHAGLAGQHLGYGGVASPAQPSSYRRMNVGWAPFFEVVLSLHRDVIFQDAGTYE